MRVLVTGASGFVGTRLITALTAAGDEVVATYTGEAPVGLRGEAHPADITDRPAIERLFAATAPEAVVHLAGLSHVGRSWDRIGDYYRVNVLGTRNVLEAAAGAFVVVASSAEVYGLVPDAEQPIDEDRPLDPRNPYAMSKAMAELLARQHGAVIVRSFNLLGPGQAEIFALPGFARQLAAIRRGDHEPVLRVGNLEARRDFVHIDDALEAYRLLLRAGRVGEVYNLGTGRALSIRQVLDRLLEVSGVAASAEIDPERFRPVDVPMTCAATARLEALGWAPQRTLDDALGALWESVRDAPAND